MAHSQYKCQVQGQESFIDNMFVIFSQSYLISAVTKRVAALGKNNTDNKLNLMELGCYNGRVHHFLIQQMTVTQYTGVDVRKDYLDNSVVEEGLVAERLWLGEGTAPFWVFNTEVQDIANYSLIVEGGPADGAAFQIRDPQNLEVVHAGDSLPALETPTLSEHRGVEPYCTRVPEPCPFHELTLADALATGKRVVFIVGTPAHCQTGVCAPVLDGLVTLAKDFSDVIFVHADVYTDETATTTAPVVDALNLTFEPVIWITDTSGVITHRFEGVWHPDEVRQVLA